MFHFGGVNHDNYRSIPLRLLNGMVEFLQQKDE